MVNFFVCAYTTLQGVLGGRVNWGEDGIIISEGVRFCSEIQSTSQVRKHCEVPSALHCKLYLEYCLPGL